MKKHYLRFGMIYCVLALVVFLAAISLYTKIKIDKVNEMAGFSVINASHFYPESYDSSKAMIHRTIQSWEYTGYRIKEEGFYSSIIDTRNNNNVIAESGDLLVVRYYGEQELEIIEDTPERHEEKWHQLTPGDQRLMLFDGSLALTGDEASALYYPRDVTITGAMCDDFFIYGGSLTFPSEGTVKTIEISQPSVVDTAGSVPYEDWIVRLDMIEYYPLGENSGDGRLNGKAHKLSDAYVKNFMNGKASALPEIRKGIFITTASAIYVYDSGNYIVTLYSVMYPLQTVIKQNLMIYILFLLALLAVEWIIISVIKKLYINQKEFELRSRKLTQDLAKDLKAPLDATKKHIENWEELDEDKRQHYSEKIISEVDHMSDMVTDLLASSKPKSRGSSKNGGDRV